ncbi:MAG TPA: hypothetical protein VG815_09035 [Chloroflexota bacterium]|nr:hypothetical protein [Chloroflexota bacterium]
MRMFRGLGALCLALAAVSASAGSVSAYGQSDSTAMKTTVVHVQPFAKSGGLAAGYVVAGTAKGYCWTTSDSTSRSDAFRCLVGNSLFDPCFSSPSGKKVACPGGANLTHVILIKLTRKLPHPQVGGKPRSWQLQLSGGATCRFDTGATFILHGLRANFDCSNKWFLFGHAATSHQPWKIRWGKGANGKLKWTGIAIAYF